jgi:hypothetical protein
VLIKYRSSYEFWRALAGEKSAFRQFFKRYLIRYSKVSDDILEEKREENPLSLTVRGRGLAGCEIFSGTNTEQAVPFFRLERVGYGGFLTE